ncbi:BMC domain-containing protein [Vibrio sp. JC009]|uniref:BMC domain-containing protein n=1 Tax=Vibrio sp. JC009 TaxID=2912314 RepID=UPI0023B090EC|nr:BMC domain-containing protein [Vibrio sp. JC009]WED21110.1 BMC domain-containing protein [Vibrio sp. JC009]
MNAIGMIETKGFLAAVEGADSMLKAADVALLNKSSATGGLITITVTGEVSAVQTAVEVAANSICRLGQNLLISNHVIARPSSTLETIIPSVIQADNIEDIEQSLSPVVETLAAEPSIAEETEVKDETSEPKSVEETQPNYSESRLKRMKLNHLRKIVSELPDTNINIDLEKATKKELIKAICDSQIIKGHK